MGMFNMQNDGTGRRVVGPRDAQQSSGPRQDPKVTLWNMGYPEGTLLNINKSVLRMPAIGKSFQVPRRNARTLLSVHGRRAGNRPGISTRPPGEAPSTSTLVAPPGYRLVKEEEFVQLTGRTEEKEVQAIVPDRVRILEEERRVARETKLAELAAAQKTVDEDDVDLDFVSGDIPDEFMEAHNSVEQDEELDDIMNDLDELD